MVAINIDGRQMAKLQRTLRNIEKGVPKAMVPAINRALAKGKTTVKREIRKEYLIKAKDIPVAVKRATRGNLNGSVSVQQGMLPLSKFKFRPKQPFNLRGWYAKQTGVSITPHPDTERKVVRRRNVPVFAQVKRSGGGVIPGAFVPAGIKPIGPFVRVAGAKRLPIKRLMTIGAAIMASQPSVGPEVQKQMTDTLAKRLDHEMKRVLDRSHK